MEACVGVNPFLRSEKRGGLDRGAEEEVGPDADDDGLKKTSATALTVRGGGLCTIRPSIMNSQLRRGTTLGLPTTLGRKKTNRHPAYPPTPSMRLSPVASKPPKAPESDAEEYTSPIRRAISSRLYSIERYKTFAEEDCQVSASQQVEDVERLTMPGSNPPSMIPSTARTARRPWSEEIVRERQDGALVKLTILYDSHHGCYDSPKDGKEWKPDLRRDDLDDEVAGNFGSDVEGKVDGQAVLVLARRKVEVRLKSQNPRVTAVGDLSSATEKTAMDQTVRTCWYGPGRRRERGMREREGCECQAKTLSCQRCTTRVWKGNAPSTGSACAWLLPRRR